MLSPSRAVGFTVIELLIGVALIGILIALGAPSMATYLQNAKVASATSAYYSGVQMARTEAIRRNTPVQFVLTSTSVAAADLANAAVPAANGRNWVVRAASGVTFALIDSKSAVEGDGVAPSVQLAASGPAGFDGTIAFNGFGGTAVAGGVYSIDLSNPSAGACAAAGPIRCRRIKVSPGGQVSACDPAAAVGDSRAC